MSGSQSARPACVDAAVEKRVASRDLSFWPWQSDPRPRTIRAGGGPGATVRCEPASPPRRGGADAGGAVREDHARPGRDLRLERGRRVLLTIVRVARGLDVSVAELVAGIR